MVKPANADSVWSGLKPAGELVNQAAKFRWPAMIAGALVSANLLGQADAERQDTGLSTSLELTGTWDSNFNRSPVEEEEFITRATGEVGYTNTFGRQLITTGLQLSQLYYHRNDDLDAQIVSGVFDWEGVVGSRILFDLGARREEAPVDRLEFTGKDIVTKDDFSGRIGFGTREKLSIFVGGRTTDQTRGASERSFLNFDEEEIFLEVEYASPDGNWRHSLSVHEGERRFEGIRDGQLIGGPNPALVPGTDPDLEEAQDPTVTSAPGVSQPGLLDPLLLADLDYDYRQYSYDVEWRITDKSQLEVGAGRFERRGNLNSDAGALVNAGWNWQVTPKVEIQLGYALSQPALGEEVNQLVKTSGSSINASWQIADQWRLEAGALRAEERYRLPGQVGEIEETFTRLRPLAIVFSRSDFLSIRLDTELVDRKSDVVWRDYDGMLANLGFRLSF